MSTYEETTTRTAGFYRDADRACVGGVCAGLAGHFGLNLKVTRFLMILAFVMATPFALLAYLGAVLLIPAESRRGPERFYWRGCCGVGSRSGRRRARRGRSRRDAAHAEELDDQEVRANSGPSLSEVRERYKTLDRRLAALEKQVTSPRFQLEQEFRKL
ncbi:MAG: PspC domain-containing protein [Gammaproteobacteria bacterium]|nr:PspC domain-containing protein [Gammaproteobacteria bacterium]MBU2677597.1 PspC domain-containing protein [Gammaproteobacteria bacterium]NNL51329.1 PspC domain-containing protein [Woeseiaceae bacterium]